MKYKSRHGYKYLYKCADDTKRGEPKIFKWAGLAARVEKWIEEQRNIGWEIKKTLARQQ